MTEGQGRLDFDADDPLERRDADARVLAVDPRRNVALEASAGTGKTRVLVDRYVGLLIAGVKPRNILLRSLNPLHAVLGDCAEIKDVRSIPRDRPRGTPAYLSPEILRLNRCCGTMDDMWALGITMLGMVGQWPQMEFTQEGLKKYPKKCHDHVKKLVELNPGDEIVEGLLAGLVEWDSNRRMDAVKCRRMAVELRDSGRWNTEKVKLKVPDEFKPISFW